MKNPNQTKVLASNTRNTSRAQHLLARSRGGSALGSVPVAQPDATQRAIDAVLGKRPLKPPGRGVQ